MKKKFIILGIFLIACISLAVFLNTNLDKNIGSAVDMPPPVEEHNSNLVYVVKEYNGNIAIFEENNDTPFKITDIRLSDLPDGDKKLLGKGISASNFQELNCILEDYCS